MAMSRRPAPELGTTSRIVAGLLAAVWLGAGLLAVVLGAMRHEWRAVIVGAAGTLFGLLWWRVARTGRYVEWRRRRRPR